jgi:hypothetical protein
MLIGGQEFQDTCEGCKYNINAGMPTRYGEFMAFGQGSICIRCPVFCCFGDAALCHPDGYRPDWAKAWRDFFDGKVQDVVLPINVRMEMPENIKKDWDKFGIDPDNCTCLDCLTKDCEYRWDLYNFGGDCLLMK